MTTQFRPNLWRDALLLLGLVVGLMQAFGLLPGWDGLSYWRASLDHLYPLRWFGDQLDPSASAYVYPPPLAQLLAPVHVLGFGIYHTLLTTSLFASLWYCAGRWSWAFVAAGLAYLAVPGLPYEFGAVLGYALNGNIQLLLAAAIVAALRYPALWAFPILTKMGPGVGVLWFAFRREWRSFAIALGTTTVIAAVSFALAPDLWRQWLTFTLDNLNTPSNIPLVPVPLSVRVVMSVLLLAWGARGNHRWTVPIAAGWAIPALYLGTEVAIWIGAIRLVERPTLMSLTPRTARRRRGSAAP